MLSTFTSYTMVARNLDRSIATVKSQPSVKRETDYYLSKITTIKSADEFVADSRLSNFAMTAFGLKDMAYAKAFIRKILAEGHDDSSAFVNKLADQRYIEFAKTFDFKRYGEATTSFSAAQQGVADKYARQVLETNVGSDNEGVRLALYFQRLAPTLTSVTEILADKALSEVARTSLQLPTAFSLTDIDKQIETLEGRLGLEDFQNPAKLSKFIKRFATLWDVGNASQNTNPVAMLFNAAQPRISDSLMASLAKLRIRG